MLYHIIEVYVLKYRRYFFICEDSENMFGMVKVILLYSFIRIDPKYDFHG